MLPELDQVKRYLFPAGTRSIQHGLFMGTTLIAALLTILVAFPFNTFQGLPWAVNVCTLATGVLAFGIHLLARRGRVLIRSFGLLMLVLLDYLWIANSGSRGPLDMFLFVGAMYAVLFFEGWGRLATLGLLLANGVGLHLLEQRYPALVVPYHDPSTRVMDFLSSFVVGTLLCAAGTWVVLASYQREREGLERASREIRDSERRYATTFQCLPAALGIADRATGRFAYVNEAFTDIFGYPPEEVIGREARELGIWADPGQRDEILARLEQAGRVRNLPVTVRRKDGSLRWVSYSGEQVILDGEPCLLSSSVDITERRVQEETLRESEEKFHRSFHSAPMMMMLSRRADGSFLEVNDAFCAVTGFDRLEVVGQSAVALGFLSPAERARIIDRVEREGAARNLEVTVHGRAGRAIACLYSGDIMTIGGEEILISMATDISERQRMEEQRQALEGQLQHLLRMESVGRLAGGIAHDMNNVLAAIMGVTELMQLRASGPQHPLDLILDATRRGRDLVKGLMAFARKEVQDAEFLDLNDLVRKEVDLLASTTLRRIELKLDLDPRIGKLRGSASALSTALMNLCVNAIDAMPEGGSLTLRTAILDAQNLELRVEDTGQGMAPEVIARAMEPFYTTKAQGKGTGLGLSMVFGTVQAHGGSIDLQSQIGKGTQVVIRLPFSPDPQPRSVWPAQPRAQAGPGAVRILLVDDDPLIRQTAPALLEALGHQVTVAGGGYEALGLVEYGSGWDLLVLDLNMPGMDGLETLGQLRRLRPDMPVLVATGHLDEASRERLEQLGRVAILAKPYSQTEIKEALETLLQR